MNLLPLATKLQDASLGVMGESIFINIIPAEAPQGILLRNLLAGTHINHELPGYYKTGFKVIVRAQSAPTGEALMANVVNALKTSSEVMVGSMRVLRMLPRTLPVVFPLSKGNLLEFSVDFDVVFTE